MLMILKFYHNLINFQTSCGICGRNLLVFDSLNLIPEVKICLVIGLLPINLFWLRDCPHHILVM